MKREGYGVSELADLAGVSVRTLHYYDEIGLLRPAERSPGGYRRYTHEELMRLQQILFFRELDVPLSDIARYLDDPEYDALETLERHRTALRARADRTSRLLHTVSETIRSIRGERSMLTDNELYDGLEPNKAEAYDAEAESKWPDEYASASKRARSMTKEQWKQVQEERDRIARDSGALAARSPASSPDSEEALELATRQKVWLEHFYPVDAERLVGLAEMYVSDERFTAHYDSHGAGAAEFLAAAMRNLAESMKR